jgi:outer membrane lipoprotein-sorting protein
MLRGVLLGLVASATLAAPVLAQSVDGLIAKSLEARGGLDKLRAIQSVRMTGEIRMGEKGAPIVIEIKRPASVRSELKLGGAVLVQASDGKDAWGIAPGDLGAQRLPPEMAQDVTARADLDGPLVDSLAKGLQVQLVGERELDLGEAHVLRVTGKSGETEDYFVDAESFLPVRIEVRRTIRGKELVAETTLDDYEETGGVMWPHTIESGIKGQAERQTLTIDKIEINPALDDARFKMPAAAAPAKRD